MIARATDTPRVEVVAATRGGAMPNGPSIEHRLERAEAKLQELLDRHRQLEEELRWADDRRSHLRRWCEEVEEAIADVRDARSDGDHGSQGAAGK
jgi:chromosome segregation ATPase